MLFKNWIDNKLFLHIIVIAVLAALLLGISFLLFSFCYWLFTIIMSTFFSVMIPFTWDYALGAWLIASLISVVFGGVKYSVM